VSGESLSQALKRGTSPQKSVGVLHNRKGPPLWNNEQAGPIGRNKTSNEPESVWG